MKKKLKKVELFGKKYVKIFVRENKNDILNNWYKGLLFFFGKAFFRGRRDEISKIFLNRTIEVLKQYKLTSYLQSFKPKMLNKLLKSRKVNNHIDRRMVIESLKFVRLIKGHNLVRRSIEAINTRDVKNHFTELTEIYGIGDKLASLYLRDVVFLFDLEKLIPKSQFEYYQPVDTWVRQIAVKLNIIDEEVTNLKVIRQEIIQKCLKLNVSPLLFNAGAWLIGSRSVDILLENF